MRLILEVILSCVDKGSAAGIATTFAGTYRLASKIEI
jgi:hypothetical protein